MSALILYFTKTTSTEGIWIVVGVLFLATTLLSFIIIKVFFLNKIDQINTVLERIKKKDFSFSKKNTRLPFSPFRTIHEEIFTYAYLKQTEIDELKKIEYFRRQFFADVSHELKTPIFAAQGFVHTLLDGAIDDTKVRIKFLRKAAKSLDGLDILVQDMLILSQIEAGEVTMHPEKFDIRQSVKEIFDQFEQKAAKKNIRLKISNDTKEPVYVHGDPRRINQVMVNLISNAVKYGKEEGYVKVSFMSSQEDERRICIAVRDDGIGIPSKDLQRIFDRFYRVEKSRSKEKGGTGLGLSIVKRILEAHQSQIKVTSHKDEGSMFSFELEKA